MAAHEGRTGRDDLGGILVIGAFTAPFLVGALYYFVGCATVVMQREGLQQAADAASLSTVVVSARGMNAIAVMNVLMMCLMSIMIPIRALLPAYAEIAARGCHSYCSCAIVADAARAEAELLQKSVRAEQRARDLFKALSDAQDALARQVPQSAVVAAGASAQRTPAFLEGAEAKVYSSSLSAQGCRKGLPVEDDSWTTVCKRTSPYIQEIAVRIAGRETLDTLDGACKSGPQALVLAQIDLSNPEGASVCREALQPPCSGGAHPKKVVRDGKNGSDHMQYWVSLQGRAFDSPRTGVEVASNRKTGKEADREQNIGFAQAEIFFDCHAAWSSPACNEDQGAMWNTKWTARLRRVHKPTLSFSNDSEVKNKLADPEHWSAIRAPLASSRRDFVTGGPASTEAARLVLSSSEGPLQ